jgi:UDP-N-acetyl-D-mannosaminuronate dehydrogenase
VGQQNFVVVVGLGEVGLPLLELLSQHYDVMGVDLAPPADPLQQVDVLHICYPFEIPDFVGETVRYVEMFKPRLTVINSTVAVGTTRAVADRSGAAVAHSPVRGKHVRMLQELRHYTKFVGATDSASAQYAAGHFGAAGLKTKVLASPEATELAKLTETTYFGLLIAWAQEVERYCDQAGTSYEEIVSIYDEISFYPKTKYFPGVIGGHCVMPNIKVLSRFADSPLLRAIEASNNAKIAREAEESPERLVKVATAK